MDEQRFAPYKMWHHEHILTKTKDESIMMQDIVTYVVPFGILKTIMNTLVISKMINEIFNFRKEVLVKMFI